MDLDDILEVIGKIFAIIGLVLLIGSAIVGLAYCFLGWILAVVAFFYGKVGLGIALLVLRMGVSGAWLSW